MELKKGMVNDHEVEFVCESYNTRSGFKHTATMFVDGIKVYGGENTCHYLNRTWERFRYESVMLGCVHNVLGDIESSLKDEFKISKGISKLTSKYKAECEDYISYDTNVQFFRELYNDICHTDNWF